MKKKIFGLLFGLILLFISSQVVVWAQETTNSLGVKVCEKGYTRVNGVCTPCNGEDVCCGIKLNTDVPFVGRCITLNSQDSTSEITEQNAFPTLVAGLTKLLMTVILIVCFLVLIVAGVLWTTGDAKKGKDLIKGVAIALALLGASGVILRLVNPNFFG